MRNKDTILGNFKPLESLTPHSPDAMLEFYNIYWKPYIKTSGYQKREKGLNVEFSNGTSAYLIKNPCSDDVVTGCLYVVYCTKHKYCKNIVENALIQNIVDTQNKFIFWTNGKTPTDFKGTRDELIEKCKTSHYYCSHLIEIDGWQISEDYPW